MVAPALISAGASLLGGLLGKPKNVSAAKNRYDDVAGIFKAAEEFKFSPFALLGSPAVGPSVVQNTMGSAIADAGLLLADGMSKQKMKGLEEERLRLENEKLREEVNRMILRPKVPLGKPSIGPDNGGRKDDVVKGSGADPDAYNNNRVGEGVTPLNLYVPYRMPDGSIRMGPNPEIPEFDQFASAGALTAADSVKDIWDPNDGKPKPSSPPKKPRKPRAQVKRDWAGAASSKPKPRSRGTWPYSGGGFND